MGKCNKVGDGVEMQGLLGLDTNRLLLGPALPQLAKGSKAGVPRSDAGVEAGASSLSLDRLESMMHRLELLHFEALQARAAGWQPDVKAGKVPTLPSTQALLSRTTAVDKLADSQPLLLPLTQSVYVSGEVASVEEVLVDVGTGYFVEMTTSAGQEFCERKASKLRASIKEIQEVLRQKQNQLLQVEQVLQHKLEGAQQGTASA
ncbi:uncharacterized protein HaLaN_10463 [Haematococcus lacustris]|uniref:Prefoldin subunit 5 n=1 Tax=Haematococcus lacustris TaxID=44745 RepID=A0A699Z690_HAELA|nr:uncharacterized protein HaLaN_10463 [Haematococcus lacustris]